MKYSYLFSYTNTWIFIMILVSAFVDIFIIKSYIDLIEFCVFCAWVLMLKKSAFAKLTTIWILLSFIVFTPIFLVIGNEIIAQKLSIWIFYLFSVMIVNKSIKFRNLI